MIANYCPACNERVPKTSEDVVGKKCPQCGARLQASPTQRSFDETQELAGPVQTQVAGESAVTPRELDFLVGKDLGVYHIESLLGRGGMGHVFVAQHRQLQRRCALKLLSPQTAQRDQGYVERFQHEGRTAASLVHPNVTIIHAIGEEGGLHFLEMEMLTGGTLQQLVGREGQVAPPKAAELMIHACAGMAAAHDQGMIHRDLKPDNILLTDSQQPKIADFGLAKRVASADGSLLAGTPNYMSPELFDGGAPSMAADVYALGATFFTLLTGQVPFAAENLSALIQHVKKCGVPDIAEFGVTAPAIVNEVLKQLLHKDPQSRCPDAGEAMQLLAHVVDQVRDLGAMTKEALGAMSHIELGEYDADSDCQQLTVHMPNGRSQRVVLERAVPPDGADHLLLIYSVCCEANEDYYEKALRLNGQMAHGGMAIRELQGVPMFCVVDTYPWATVDAHEIRLSTAEVAKHADDVEHELTGKDLR